MPIIKSHSGSSGDRRPHQDVTSCCATGGCNLCDSRALSICSVFREEDLSELDKIVQHHIVQPKTVLFEQGQVIDFIYSVSEGMVRLFRLLSDGQRQIIGFAVQGDFLGFSTDKNYEYSAEMIDCGRVCRFSNSDFNEILKVNHKLMRELFERGERELNALRYQITLLGRKNAEERLASFLLTLRDRLAKNGYKSVHVVLPMSRQDIADFLGLTIETVSRTFSKLAREKYLVIVPDGVRILEFDALQALANA